jgi:uncharacterized hydrophobic protein (TIGR00271 family)
MARMPEVRCRPRVGDGFSEAGAELVNQVGAARKLQPYPPNLPAPAADASAMTKPETSDIEEAAEEHLGVRSWDRPAIFRDSAGAATDNGLPYWLVLVLSAGIATLGLALNSSSVVIGAMLVAPLLAPVMGLALSLAVGDGRLAVQTTAVVAVSTLAVVLAAALLTLMLPFQTITLEISARVRPTTLDLAIAIFSGLVGAVVTVARGSRLSAAIPGVAIAVALIPPLAVAGFGIGIGWNEELIRGSMLLYGANLAGIVLSGMGVFLLVGMHRQDVVQVAREWREKVEPHGLAAWADRPRWVRSLGVVSSARSRIALVGGFVVALGFPLSSSLAQIAREARVERAVDEVSGVLFAVEGSVSILNRQVVYGSDRIQVYLRVATTRWFGDDARQNFERRASALAQEPVHLSLEQIPTTGENIDQMSSLLAPLARRPAPSTPAPAPSLSGLLTVASDRLRGALRSVALPDSVVLIRGEVGTTGTGGTVLRVTYASRDSLPPPALQMLRRQIAASVELPSAEVLFTFSSLSPRALAGQPEDSVTLRQVADALAFNDELGAVILQDEEEMEADSATESARRWLVDRGIDAARIHTVLDGGSGTRIGIVPRSGGAAAPPDAVGGP